MHLALVVCLLFLELFAVLPPTITLLICIALVLVVVLLLLHSKLKGVETKIDNWITEERTTLQYDLAKAKADAVGVAKKL